jgi:ABC-type sugar transport system ATPase subunit
MKCKTAWLSAMLGCHRSAGSNSASTSIKSRVRGRSPSGDNAAHFATASEHSIRAIAEVDLHLRSPDTLVGELSGGQRQGVAIARAMYFKSKVLILDESTNHLSVKETAKVLGFVKGLRAQNVTGILITHNLNRVFLSCERVVTIARGRIVLDKKIHETSMEEIVAANDRVIPSFSQSRTVPTYAPGCSIGCGAV